MSPGAGARRAIERANGLPYCWEGMPKIAPLTHASRRLMAAAAAIGARRGRTASMGVKRSRTPGGSSATKVRG